MMLWSLCRKCEAVKVARSACKTFQKLYPVSSARRSIVQKASVPDDEQPYIEDEEEEGRKNQEFMIFKGNAPDRRGRIRTDWSDLEIRWLINWIERQESGKNLNWSNCVLQIKADASVRSLFESRCHLCKEKLREKYKRLKAQDLV